MKKHLLLASIMVSMVPNVTLAQDIASADRFYARYSLPAAKASSGVPSDPAPPEEEYEWTYGEWSDWSSLCSTELEPSVRTRTASCVGSQGEAGSDDLCDGSPSLVEKEVITRGCEIGGIKNGEFNDGLNGWAVTWGSASIGVKGDAAATGAKFRLVQSVQIPAGAAKSRYVIIRGSSTDGGGGTVQVTISGAGSEFKNLTGSTPSLLKIELPFAMRQTNRETNFEIEITAQEKWGGPVYVHSVHMANSY